MKMFLLKHPNGKYQVYTEDRGFTVSQDFVGTIDSLKNGEFITPMVPCNDSLEEIRNTLTTLYEIIAFDSKKEILNLEVTRPELFI